MRKLGRCMGLQGDAEMDLGLGVGRETEEGKGLKLHTGMGLRMGWE